MDWWGFVIEEGYGNVLAEDFGYETEEDAEKFGEQELERIRQENGPLASLRIGRRWEDID